MGTAALAGALPGATVAVFGPLGNAFPLIDGAWWVAGGIGLAPFVPLPQRGFFGARSMAEAAVAQKLGIAAELATDDGSSGFHGSVVELLDRELADTQPTAVYTCGPTAMMAAVCEITRKHRVATWVSLEARMACGIGICRGCSHRDAGGGWRCICVDGPVYRAQDIFA